MRIPPASVGLTFPAPNYEHPVTRGPALVIINGIFIALSTIAVLLRLYARLYIKRWFGIDDVFIIGALINAIGLCALVILANTKYAWSRHIWDIPYGMIPPSEKCVFVAKIFFVLAGTCVRASILCFYHRLVQESNKRVFKRALHWSQAFNVAIGAASVILTIFQCTPIEGFWAFPPKPHQKCLDEGRLTLGCGAVITAADLLCTLLPIPVVMKLQMPIRQRIGIAILLNLGLVVTGASVARTYFVWKGLIDSYDQTWYAYPLWIMAAVEIDLAIICACAPYIRPLFIHVAKPTVNSLGSRIGRLFGSTPRESWNAITSAEAGKTLDSQMTTTDMNTTVDGNQSEMTFVPPSSPRSIGTPRSSMTHWPAPASPTTSLATTLRERDSQLAFNSHPYEKDDYENRRSRNSLGSLRGLRMKRSRGALNPLKEEDASRERSQERQGMEKKF